MNNSNYILMSNNEPTDEQLSLLMQEVLVDVKKRSEMADLKYKQILNQNIATVLSKYRK